MHVAAIQFDIAWEDKKRNHAHMAKLLRAADLPPGCFVLLPEMADTGFSFNLDGIIASQGSASLEWARAIAAEGGWTVQMGYVTRGADGRGRNCATIVHPDGSTSPTYEKVHPFSFGREAEFFTAGERLVLHAAGNDNNQDEAGPGPGAMICPLICYDLRFPELWRLAAIAGAEVFAIGASWPAARQSHWRALVIARAIENQAYVIAVNRIGNDPHIAYTGGSLIVSPMGEILAEAGDEEVVLQAELDLESLRDWRSKFPALRDIHRELLGNVTTIAR
ncbi:MAG: nitrilase-related carbon-nitrogen hydrolase [Phycisphaerales bacterium]